VKILPSGAVIPQRVFPFFAKEEKNAGLGKVYLVHPGKFGSAPAAVAEGMFAGCPETAVVQKAGKAFLLLYEAQGEQAAVGDIL
jgi:hypothetical protein